MARPSSNPTFSAFAHREFRYLVASNATYFLGLMGQMVLRSILAWNLTHSPLALSYVSLALGVPMLLLAPLGGVIVDRYERRGLIIKAQSLILVGEGMVLALLIAGTLQFWQLLLTTVVTGSAFTVISPARHAIVVQVVPRADLNNALALAAASLNLAKVLGPAAMGVLVPWLGMVASYSVSLTVYTIGLLTMLGVARHPIVTARHASPWAGLRDGLAYLRGHTAIRQLFFLGFVPAFFGLPFQYLLIVYAEEVWAVGTRGFGFLQAAAGLGAVLGTVIVARQSAHSSTHRTLVVSLLGFGLCLGAFALSPLFPLGLVLVLLSMLAANVFVTRNTIAVQLLTSDAMRGRMSSIIFMTISLTPLGTMPLAWLAESLGPQWALVLSAGAMLVVGAALFAFSPGLRHLDAALAGASAPAAVNAAAVAADERALP